jgi:hypothetical protein
VAGQLVVGLHRYPGTMDHSTDQPPATRADLEREAARYAARLKVIYRQQQAARPAPGGPANRVA